MIERARVTPDGWTTQDGQRLEQVTLLSGPKKGANVTVSAPAKLHVGSTVLVQKMPDGRWTLQGEAASA